MAELKLIFSRALLRRANLLPALGKLSILLVLAGLATVAWLMGEEFLDELTYLQFELEGSPWLGLARVSLILAVLALFWRAYLAIAYREPAPCQDCDLPTVTVVVPAYNEGAQVLPALRSVLAGDYPPHLLQLVAVDDGSRDDTWEWMQRAKEELGDRLELIRLPANRGKRHALYQGFQRAWGEIWVTIDSDSEVLPDALRHLVTPMARDPQVGAMAGNVRVLNRDKGLIPRMMDVNFTFSFDFMRSAQSRINTVMTTPGALSAYRAEVVRPHLEAWLNQRFCGQPANIGEDRALTNLVLREGFHVLFARRAIVLTDVPLSYRGLVRMLMRWARSNVRETLVMMSFLFRRFRQTPALGARVQLVLQLFQMTAGEWLKLGALGVILANPEIMLVNVLYASVAGAMIPALIYVLRRRDSNFLWAFPYSLFWITALGWISLWALITPHRNGWLTRGLATHPEPAQELVAEDWVDNPAAGGLVAVRSKETVLHIGK
ncbi:MAG: glycosyltransferase [Proteobacteria bacterium]|nr:glycosyltransferase [Pseudomonadota bacterium]MBU1449828.1 glycosyltransferase [Pseudomonadota bacterium]MBU2467972.1 glycosyltransferase [Pseudomonadota bacterium]MBU2516606.1 glycosyltransferase [Pseudomonadota bacterium]